MDLKQLKAMGLTTSNPLVKRNFDITYRPLRPADTWADPDVPEREEEAVTETWTVHVRRYTAADVIALSAARDDEERAYIALQRGTFTADGAHLFPTMDDAYGVNLEVFAPLITLLGEFNGRQAKKSAPRTSSGASSRSSSAARLQKRATDSTTMSSSSGSSTETSSVP